MRLEFNPEQIRYTMQLWREVAAYKGINPDGIERTVEQRLKVMRQFMNIARGWGDVMRSAETETESADECRDFAMEVQTFYLWVKDEVDRLEHPDDFDAAGCRIIDWEKVNEQTGGW